MQELIFSPAPGSDEARTQGCLCPVVDNHFGAGYLGDGASFGWIIIADCPVHGQVRQVDSKGDA